jgi:hypothetical protein
MLFLVLVFFVEVQEKYIESAIRKNKIFQTIGNTKFGGVIFGFIFSYHSEFVFPVVNKLPINAKA